MGRDDSSWRASFRAVSRPTDGIVDWAGRILDIGEGLVRRARRGEPPLMRDDLKRLRSEEALDDDAEGPSAGRALVLLPAVAWRYRFQRPQQLARATAEVGPPVLYVDGFARRRVMPRLRTTFPSSGIAVMTVAVAGRPDPYRSILGEEEARWIAEAVVGGLVDRPLGVVVQLPFWTPAALELRRRLGVPLVYDRIDLHTAFPGVPDRIGEVEERLMAAADAVTATSDELLEGSRPHNDRAHLLPNAVRLEDFPLVPPPPPPVRIGSVGAVDDRFDLETVLAVAEAHPEWRLEFAGRVESTTARKTKLPANVRLWGEIPYHKVPRFLGRLHAGFVPHRDQLLTRAQDAVKRYEMLAAGLPVVMPPRPCLGGPRAHVWLYSTADEAGEALSRAVTGDDLEARRERRATVRDHTWRHRARGLLGVVRQAADAPVADRVVG